MSNSQSESRLWTIIAANSDGGISPSPTSPPVPPPVPTVWITGDTHATEGGATGLFNVRRSSGTGALTVNYATPTGTATNGLDYSGAGSTGGSVSFADGETTKPITITAVHDTIVEVTETVIIALATGTGYSIAGGSASINIIDNTVGTGLLSRYFNYFDNNQVERELRYMCVDGQVNFDWGISSPVYPVNIDKFLVTWTGRVKAKTTADWTFITNTDDGVRLTVGGTALINDWNTHLVTRNTGTIRLDEGTWYDIKMEYYDNTGSASAKLQWSSASQAEEIIPTANLLPEIPPQPTAAGDGTGLAAHYYATEDLTSPKLAKTDSTLDFNWGLASPAAAIPTDRFSARWTGKVTPQFSGKYTFTTGSNEGIRIFVNQKLLDSYWLPHDFYSESRATIDLVAGQQYDIEVEYFEKTGEAEAKLYWSADYLVREIIPTSQLTPIAIPEFLVKGITFSQGNDRTVWSDSGVQYKQDQWLNTGGLNGDLDDNLSINDAKHIRNPIMFVKGQFITIDQVVLTGDILPSVKSGMTPDKYNLIGIIRFQGNGTAQEVVVTSGLGRAVGRDWIFNSLKATGSTLDFKDVAYDSGSTIEWKLELKIMSPVNTRPTSTIEVGFTRNPTYVTAKPIDLVTAPGFRALESFLSWGCANTTAGAQTEADIVAAVWKAFSEQKLQDVKNKPIIYYATWSVQSDNIASIANHVAVKSLLYDVNCVTLTMYMISALRAQGMEYADNVMVAVGKEVETVVQKSNGQVITYEIPLKENIFVKSWLPKAQNIKTTTLVGYDWTNITAATTLYKLNAKVWNYTWAQEEIGKVQNQLTGQNNSNPLAIFVDHYMVQLKIGNGVASLYDPSYGKEYLNLADFETKSVAYFGLAEGRVIAIRENGPAADLSRMVTVPKTGEDITRY